MPALPPLPALPALLPPVLEPAPLSAPAVLFEPAELAAPAPAEPAIEAPLLPALPCPPLPLLPVFPHATANANANSVSPEALSFPITASRLTRQLAPASPLFAEQHEQRHGSEHRKRDHHAQSRPRLGCALVRNSLLPFQLD